MEPTGTLERAEGAEEGPEMAGAAGWTPERLGAALARPELEATTDEPPQSSHLTIVSGVAAV